MILFKRFECVMMESLTRRSDDVIISSIFSYYRKSNYHTSTDSFHENMLKIKSWQFELSSHVKKFMHNINLDLIENI